MKNQDTVENISKITEERIYSQNQFEPLYSATQPQRWRSDFPHQSPAPESRFEHVRDPPERQSPRMESAYIQHARNLVYSNGNEAHPQPQAISRGESETETETYNFLLCCGSFLSSLLLQFRELRSQRCNLFTQFILRKSWLQRFFNNFLL